MRSPKFSQSLVILSNPAFSSPISYSWPIYCYPSSTKKLYKLVSLFSFPTLPPLKTTLTLFLNKPKKHRVLKPSRSPFFSFDNCHLYPNLFLSGVLISDLLFLCSSNSLPFKTTPNPSISLQFLYKPFFTCLIPFLTRTIPFSSSTSGLVETESVFLILLTLIILVHILLLHLADILTFFHCNRWHFPILPIWFPQLPYANRLDCPFVPQNQVVQRRGKATRVSDLA